jgi:hypothetical protein
VAESRCVPCHEPLHTYQQAPKHSASATPSPPPPPLTHIHFWHAPAMFSNTLSTQRHFEHCNKKLCCQLSEAWVIVDEDGSPTTHHQRLPTVIQLPILVWSCGLARYATVVTVHICRSHQHTGAHKALQWVGVSRGRAMPEAKHSISHNCVPGKCLL